MPNTPEPQYEYQWVFRYRNSPRAHLSHDWYSNENEFYSDYERYRITHTGPLETTRRLVEDPRIEVFCRDGTKIQKRFIRQSELTQEYYFHTFEEAKRALLESLDEQAQHIAEKMMYSTELLARIHALTEEDVVPVYMETEEPEYD